MSSSSTGRKLRVAVIGAGVCGLTAIKGCLDEELEPVCLERTDHIGGLWHYEEEPAQDGQGSVMKSTTINSSKELTAFSDFLVPRDYPNYMHNTKLLDYFTSYAQNFGLLDYIKYKQEVMYVTKADNFEQNGLWRVTIKDLASDIEREEIFDAVLVCTGHHAYRNIPKFPGQDIFQGKQLHTNQYRHHKGYEDKRVLVIGVGSSGADMAVELSKISSKVFLSTRRGTWIHSKIGSGGVPADLLNARRVNMAINNLLPLSLLNSITIAKLEQHVDHVKYGLRPRHPPLAQHPLSIDELVGRIASGGVVVKPNVKRLTATGVEFTDGTHEDNIDAIIYATGYVYGFPFIDKAVVDIVDNKADLFKFCFPPDLSPPTLALIGFVQPLGPTPPLAELVCRWATQIFKGTRKLPPRDEMMRDIRAKQEAMAKRYVESNRHTIQVDGLPFMDEIAELAGCKPKLWRLLLTDPRLALACFFGPCTPYQYRLHGPKAWSGARDAILTQWDRIYAPSQTREPYVPSWSPTSLIKYAILAAVLVIVYIYWQA